MKMYPLSLIWLESWNQALKGIIEVNSRKKRSKLYHMIVCLGWSKKAKSFPVNSHGKFLYWYQASRRTSKWTLVFLSQTFRNFSAFSALLVILGIFVGFLKRTFGFYWSLALNFSYIMVRLSEGRFLFVLACD